MVTEVFNCRTLGSLDKFLFKRNNLVTANYDEVSNKIFSSTFSNSLKNFSIFKIIEYIQILQYLQNSIMIKFCGAKILYVLCIYVSLEKNKLLHMKVKLVLRYYLSVWFKFHQRVNIYMKGVIGIGINYILCSISNHKLKVLYTLKKIWHL